jgi:Flp pilus assembly protein TadG
MFAVLGCQRAPNDKRGVAKFCAFIRRADGATAVEFGLVVAPFIAMLFAILQTTLVFFAGRVLDLAVAQSSRLILTGQAQDAGMTQSAFANAVCGKIYALFTCGNLMIDVETASSFSTANTSTPTLTFDKTGNVTNTWQYQPGNPGDIVVVRVMYQWPVFLGPLGFNLSNLANGKRLLMASAAFKNEPYQ